MIALHQFTELRPFGGFGLIMADPPWSFSNWSEAGEEKNATAHYGCMSAADIAALPVGALAADDCVLWMWATNPLLPAAVATVEAWGFEFKTAGTWVKRTARGKDAFGTGYILRSANEPFLIATRGRPRIAAKNVRSTISSFEGCVDLQPGSGWADVVVTIEAPAREHSRKPDAAFAAAAALVGEVPRIELFSRQSRVGWASWGLEASKFDQSVALGGVAS